MRKQALSIKKRIALLLAVGGALLAAILVIQHAGRIQKSPSIVAPSIATNYPGLDLEDPAPSFITLRYVADTGGDTNTRQQALIWLDDHARTLQPLSPMQETWILSMLNSGGHTAWDIEYKLWIFNSAFNALHHSENPEPLTKLLLQLAVNDTHRTMRLYALQHIGTQISANRIPSSLASEIHAFLANQISLSDSDIAGTALELLVAWSSMSQITADAGNKTHQLILDRALEIATDSSRPVDVRVTALHAAGANVIGLSRTLATDSTQPMLIRKAAIASIGRHGSESDLDDLEKLSSESSRIAQAADPARAAITFRINHPNAPAPIPF